MAAEGFTSNAACFTRRIGQSMQHVARDSIRGSAWRLFLAVGDVPIQWPVVSAHEEQRRTWAEAESPWFNYFTDLDPNDASDAKVDDRN
jgi:hypothetical protein